MTVFRPADLLAFHEEDTYIASPLRWWQHWWVWQTGNGTAAKGETTKKERQVAGNLPLLYNINKDNYPPKLSYMMLSGSTPSESSMETTAFDIGPGPHM